MADRFGGITQASATITITVTGIKDAPLAEPDAAATLRNATRTIMAADLLKNDGDPEGDALSVLGVGNASHGTVSLDPTSGEITFTPEAGFLGDATFEYTVSDGQGGFSIATMTVKVLTTQGNTAPVAVDDFLLGTCGDDLLIVNGGDAAHGGSANDIDPEGDALTVTGVGGASGGTVALFNGEVVFTVATGTSDAGHFSYTVSGGAERWRPCGGVGQLHPGWVELRRLGPALHRRRRAGGRRVPH